MEAMNGEGKDVRAELTIYSSVGFSTRMWGVMIKVKEEDGWDSGTCIYFKKHQNGGVFRIFATAEREFFGSKRFQRGTLNR